MAREVLVLPPAIVGVIDVNRLGRELEAFEDYMEQAKARKSAATTPPRTSRLLDDLASANQLNLLQDVDRERLTLFLTSLKDAPSVHISFAADPSALFTQKIVAWFRTNIHPNVMVQIGLQPNIAAGCVVRTENKIFDFSLRENFTQSQQSLIDAIGGKK